MDNLTTINRILLVDDDTDDCELFGEALHDCETYLNLSCLSDNEQLLKAIERINPDLIFLDVNMPKRTGYECLQEILSHKNYASIPVIMYSNTGRNEDIENAYKLGATLFLRKPSTYSGLVDSLKKILNKEWTRPSTITAQYFLNGRYHPFS